MENPQTILTNIKRFQGLLEGTLDPEVRVRVQRLLAEARAEFAPPEKPASTITPEQCIRRASVCDHQAQITKDTINRKFFQDTADQWRRLADGLHPQLFQRTKRT